VSFSTSKGQKAAEKEARQRSRDCLDEKVLHIRCGSWRGTGGAEVTFLGTTHDLHGTVCTCCPRRTTAVAS
jgi:hypothetical protein